MLNLGSTEMLLLGVVAVLVISPKDLPAFMRTVGGYIGKAKKVASDFQKQLETLTRDEEIDKLQKQLADAGRKAEHDIRRATTVAIDKPAVTPQMIKDRERDEFLNGLVGKKPEATPGEGSAAAPPKDAAEPLLESASASSKVAAVPSNDDIGPSRPPAEVRRV